MPSPPPPNRLVALLRPIMGNAAWDAIKNTAKLAYDNWALFLVIIGFIGSGITALVNRLRGMPSDVVGILVVFGVVVFVALCGYVVGRVRDKKRPVESFNGSDTQPDAAKPELPVATQPEALRCPYESVHRIADHEAKNIRDFVTVSRVAVWEHKLNDPVPTIKWGFMIENKSILPISLIEVRNNISFEKTVLAERRFDDLNEVQHLGYWREGSVVFEQRLSGPEAQHIKSMPEGKFRFNRLIIEVGNPNSFPVIEPQALVIGDDLETALNGITYKETRATAILREERDRLKGELEKAKGADWKLTFEIDEKQSQVDCTGGGTAGRRISPKIQLRCMKLADYPMAIREFHCALIKQGDPEQVIVPQEGALVVMGHPDMKDIAFSNGWTVTEPLTGYRWFMFYLEVTAQQLQMLSRDYFMRVTMVAVGQQPFSIDFDVNNWNDARASNSDITVRH
jgi:hypothetical protein